jgi:hypothetical protein
MGEADWTPRIAAPPMTMIPSWLVILLVVLPLSGPQTC